MIGLASVPAAVLAAVLATVLATAAPGGPPSAGSQHLHLAQVDPALPAESPAVAAPDNGAAPDEPAAAPTDPSAEPAPAAPDPAVEPSEPPAGDAAPEAAPPAAAPVPEEGAADAAPPQSGAPGRSADERVIVQEAPEADSPYPRILRSVDDLPPPVRETWTRLVEAARSGDIQRLRELMEDQPQLPQVAVYDLDDPIEYLQSLSIDPEGREILAILLEVLEAGFLHLDAGGPDEIYLWPYFAAYPVDALTPEQIVELFTLIPSSDYVEMRSFGAYFFFRLGIGPDGTWRFFVAGD